MSDDFTGRAARPYPHPHPHWQAQHQGKLGMSSVKSLWFVFVLQSQ